MGLGWITNRSVLMIVIVLLLIPVLMPYEALGTQMIIWGLLALGYNILYGYTGLLSFGHAAYFGLGAYATGIMLIRTHCSLLAGITGILLASEFKAGVSSRATGYEFDALVISLLGGVSIAGGFGSVLGMFVGAIILAVVTSSATGLLLSPDWQFTIKGVVTFIAILAQRFALDRRKG